MTKESLSRAETILSELSDEDWLKKEVLEKTLMDAAGRGVISCGRYDSLSRVLTNLHPHLIVLGCRERGILEKDSHGD